VRDEVESTEFGDDGHAERRLLAVERRMALAELVRRDPIVTVENLARRFNVSAQTVRRDFQFLEERGILTRTYGGAVTRADDVLHLSLEREFRAREQEQAAQKQAIARLAVELVEPGSTVMLDGSTTVLQLARTLPLDIELTAIVNALPVAHELIRQRNVSLTMIGGTMREASFSFTGPISEATLRRLFADTAFISARGLALQRGLTEANPLEAALKEIMIVNSTRVVAMMDSTKLGRTALTLLAPLNSIDILITDEGTDDAILEAVRANEVDVRIATVT
jgi:DeoR family transcriptional regulator of aga operon